ncbi:MAG: cytochrome c3 family protein [Bacteroidota bacterium]
MKRKLLVSVLAVLGSISSSLCGQISGTAHDFSSESWAPAENKMCAVCHTVHNAISIPEAPLWNHESTAVAGYSLYSSATFDSDGGTTITDPDASSKLCLSCHDGTVALENFGGISGGTNYIDPGYRIGGVTGNDLSNNHPISFDYTTALAALDGGLNDPSTTSSGLGGTIASDMLFGNRMQCASCHDVHNKFGVSNLLKMSNTNSQLCLTCHNK